MVLCVTSILNKISNASYNLGIPNPKMMEMRTLTYSNVDIFYYILFILILNR